MKGWFERRGWSFGAGESIDLYRRVDGESLREEEGKELIKRLESQGVRYGPMEVGKEEELFAFQEKEFSTYAVSLSFEFTRSLSCLSSSR